MRQHDDEADAVEERAKKLAAATRAFGPAKEGIEMILIDILDLDPSVYEMSSHGETMQGHAVLFDAVAIVTDSETGKGGMQRVRIGFDVDELAWTARSMMIASISYEVAGNLRRIDPAGRPVETVVPGQAGYL